MLLYNNMKFMDFLRLLGHFFILLGLVLYNCIYQSLKVASETEYSRDKLIYNFVGRTQG